MRIGVVGASGFVGSRALEFFQNNDKNCEVRPIVHSEASLKRGNFDSLDPRIANSFDVASLQSAFEGCEVILHSILGSAGLIRGCIEPTYQAAQRAGVRRIIYLSSMIVHSCAPAPGTTEESALIENQPFPSHGAKIDAERKLLKLRAKGNVEVVIFRPGIVFGPRSRWVTELADQLCQGTAYFIKGGQGVCNTVYVDNLLHGIRLALQSPAADGQAFFVGDREAVTWFDFYAPFAQAFGLDPAQIAQLDPPNLERNWKRQTLDTLWNSVVIQKSLAAVPESLKQDLKHRLRPAQPSTAPAQPSPAPKPVVTEMMATLQQSTYKLPYGKAQRLLGYEPIFSFQEGYQRSIDWLATQERFQNRLSATSLDQP